MPLEIVKTKIYGTEWDDHLFCLSLHFNENGFVTSQYRPPELGDILQLKEKVHQNNEEEFLSIWTKFVIGLSVCSEERDPLERNIGALTFTVIDTLEKSQRLSFETLLDYMDCFSIMLKEENFSEKEIKAVYLPITLAVLKNFSDRIIDRTTGLVFISSSKYQEISRLLETSGAISNRK
ncbi:MAG: hypothetical protein J1D77_00250 [Muribaculaceae bacterium]|nr:hypothetical protein [Muribaculaceae bacterium]